jgi:type IV pilus assembly protein PilV
MMRQTSIVAATRRLQAGVGLIEVMVAVLVISIGFLGIAALQAMSLSTNNSAMARSLATIDSYSILDVLRADRTNALTGAYNGKVTANNCPATANTLVTDQLNQWCSQLASDLGGVATTTGNVVCTAATGICTVTIVFDDSRASNSGVTAATQTTQDVTVTTQVVL